MDRQVEEIKSKVDIVSVIAEHVNLKKAGRNFKANCPFHSEKTPSFVVSPELQIYKCFGCGESGDVISFLQKYEGMEFYEALKILADRVGVKLTPLKGEGTSEKDKYYSINKLATQFYQYILQTHPAGKSAFNYLTVERGLSVPTIKEFALGFSPEHPNALVKFLVGKKKFTLNDLEKAGLVYTRGSFSVDRFRGRVVFPLFDHRDNIVGFAGRVMPGKNSDLAKYINSPETLIYHKSNVLYGLNLAKRHIKKKNEAVVVEGELDMISSWQTGVKNVVAIKGSALTEEQVRLLARFCNRLVLALDTDLAGDMAARRGIEIADREGLEVKVAVFEGFKDPDEAARNAPEKLKEGIKGAIGVWDFIINSLFLKFDGDDGTTKAQISREVVPVLRLITDSIVQAHYTNLVAQRMGVPLEAVAKQIAKRGTENAETKIVTLTKVAPKKERREILEEKLLALGLRTEPQVLLTSDVKQIFLTPFVKRIIEELESFNHNVSFDLQSFAKYIPAELSEKFSEILLRDEGDGATQIDALKREFKLVANELFTLDTREKLKEAAQIIKEYEKKGNQEELIKANENFSVLTRKLKELEANPKRGIIL